MATVEVDFIKFTGWVKDWVRGTITAEDTVSRLGCVLGVVQDLTGTQ